MAFEFNQNTAGAKEDFRRARRRSAVREIVDQVKGKSSDLLSYEDVVKKLKGLESSTRELKDIPIKSIVGSVGRYRDFNRGFLPRKGIRSERWARVKMAMSGLRGVPPIEVYQIGEAYFVKDGNHRVSVAKEMGFSHFQAYVTEVKTKVPLSSKVDLDEIIIKSEFVDFLAKTNLDQLRPDADLKVTVPGEYDALLEHIKVHRYYMGINQNQEVEYADAVTHWYDTFYLPIVEIIHKRGLLREFSGRTDTDLYLFITQHKSELEQTLGWEITLEKAASDIEPNTTGYRPSKHARVSTSKEDSSFTQDSTLQKPLFSEILVAINGNQNGWNCFEHAALIAQRENGARLQGLHMLKPDGMNHQAEINKLQQEFNERCSTASLPGSLAVEAGGRIKGICQRARYTDLTLVCLVTKSANSKLGSGLSRLLRSCPRPLLVVPDSKSPLNKILLAYDGSKLANETLFTAAYLTIRWKADLVVLTAHSDNTAATKIQKYAREYLLSKGVDATYITENKLGIVESILSTAKQQQCNLIVMGAYGQNAPWYLNVGVAVAPVLQNSNLPVMICG